MTKIFRDLLRTTAATMTAVSIATTASILPADADVAEIHYMETTYGDNGAAGFQFKLTWFDTKTHFGLEGWLEDLCPKDGHAAVLRTRVAFMDGTTTVWEFRGQDDDGCNLPRDPETYGVRLGWGPEFDKRVKGVYIRISEEDTDVWHGDVFDFKTEYFDNPYTG
jgi:hypothetical protein